MRQSLLVTTLAALVVAGCAARIHPTLAPELTASCRSVQPEAMAVRWSEVPDASNRSRMDSWCAAVGPILFRRAAPDRIDGAEPSLDDLVFVSWNVHVGHGDIDAFIRDVQAGRLSGGRRRSHIVLMLQEAVRSDGVPPLIPAGASAAKRIGSAAGFDRSEIDRLAERLALSVFYVPSMRNGAPSTRDLPADRGNAILSSLPLSDPVAIELPGERQRRVAVAAIVAVKSGDQRIPLSIGAAHLDTLGPPRTLWVLGAAAARAAQAKTLTTTLPSGPMILGADLNSWLGPNESAVRELLQFFPSTPTGSRAPTASARLLLDYMFFRPPSGWRARLERAPHRYGSDHYPLVGWLES